MKTLEALLQNAKSNRLTGSRATSPELGNALGLCGAAGAVGIVTPLKFPCALKGAPWVPSLRCAGLQLLRRPAQRGFPRLQPCTATHSI